PGILELPLELGELRLRVAANGVADLEVLALHLELHRLSFDAGLASESNGRPERTSGPRPAALPPCAERRPRRPPWRRSCRRRPRARRVQGLSRQERTRRRRCAGGRPVAARAGAGRSALSPVAATPEAPSPRRARGPAAPPGDDHEGAHDRDRAARTPARTPAAAAASRASPQRPRLPDGEARAPSRPRSAGARRRRTPPPPARRRTRADVRSTPGSGPPARRWESRSARKRAVAATAGSRGSRHRAAPRPQR